MQKRLVAIAFVLLGCGSPQPAATPHAEQAGAELAGPKRLAKSGALFTVVYEALLPVACFDAKHDAWMTGAPCLDLVPDDATVALESGRTAKVGGHRVPTITGCELATKLLMFEGAKDEKPGAFAIWPPSVEGRVRRLAWDTTKKGAGDLSTKDRERIVTAMRALAPVETLRVVQSASADLDGAGGSEVFLSATSGDFDPAAKKGTSALLFGEVAGGPLAVLRSSDHAVFRVEGIVDVDDDGVSEAWISERTFHENGQRSDAMTLVRSGKALPAIESCWPPGKQPQ